MPDEIPDRRVAAVKADQLREALSDGDIENARDVHAALGQFLAEHGDGRGGGRMTHAGRGWSRAVQHWRRTGCIPPGRSGEIAAFRAATVEGRHDA